MRTLWYTLLLLSAFSAAAAPCHAQDNARLFVTAMKAYQTQDYATAIANLEPIAESGVRNGELFYNLGNAHLKSDHLGHAILWYERALKLLPDDPDLRFNYDYARSLTLDAVEQETVSIERILFFWKYELSGRTIVFAAIVANLVFWCLLLTYRFTGRRGLRWGAIAAMIPAILFILTAAFNYYESAHQRQAIVLAEKAPVRSGLEPTSTQLFILHAGAKVQVVKEMKDHIQIRFSEDKMGWVENGVIGLI
jgi:tetratricopeptide (TPR) repeat protein